METLYTDFTSAGDYILGFFKFKNYFLLFIEWSETKKMVLFQHIFVPTNFIFGVNVRKKTKKIIFKKTV